MAQLSRRNAVLGAFGALVSGFAARSLLDGGSGKPRLLTRGRGRWTTFGSVAVLASSRKQLSSEGAPVQGHGDAGHGDAGQGSLPAGAVATGIWSAAVRVEVEVHNGLDRDLLFSPGQFRLRVGSDGPSVTPYDMERPPGSLPSGTTLTTWVSYLAPDSPDDLAVEFTEADTSEVLRLAVTPTATPIGGVPS